MYAQLSVAETGSAPAHHEKAIRPMPAPAIANGIAAADMR
jgi:hypothetical protein